MRLYDTKEKAEEALNKYNETHEFLESDIKTRKKGTGTIKKSRNGKRFNAQIAINKTYFYNTFDTEEQDANRRQVPGQGDAGGGRVQHGLELLRRAQGAGRVLENY